MTSCVDGQFMESERDRLDNRRRQFDIGSTKNRTSSRKGCHLQANEFLDRDTRPSSFGEEIMCASERLHPVLDSSGIKSRVVGVGEPNDAIDDGEDVLRAVVNLHEQAML